MQSKRQILFPTENYLLRSLQASIDALDEKALYSRETTTLRDCYLDLRSFPEDHRIHPATLLDIWVERYNLDEDGITAMAIFLELSSQNLVNLALARYNWLQFRLATVLCLLLHITWNQTRKMLSQDKQRSNRVRQSHVHICWLSVCVHQYLMCWSHENSFPPSKLFWRKLLQ